MQGRISARCYRVTCTVESSSCRCHLIEGAHASVMEEEKCR
jgi:hypothetical protein